MLLRASLLCVLGALMLAGTAAAQQKKPPLSLERCVVLLGPAARFQERMQYLAKTIPNGNGRVLLLPGLGHVPHLEAPERVLPPLVSFLKEGLAAK